jgi:tetratricopeptide (TPR) repeat protein
VARLALALSLLFWSSAWGAPSLTGLWSAGDLGLLEFSAASEGKLVAKFKRGGQCNFKPDIQIITGAFEGNVFVGSVLLCQVGPSCQPEATYPFLAVWHESSLSGDVKLDTACRSPGLDLKRLNIAVATAEEKLQVRQETGSAAQVAAAKPISKREQQDLAEKALLIAGRKMKEGDYRAAAQSFERGISYADENWAAHAGLGVAELNLKNTEKALASLQRAVQLTKGARLNDSELGDLHYNLACAQSRSGMKREAMQSLTRAIKLLPQGTMAEQLDKDRDLDPLRNESDFRRLLADARIARERLNRKRSP